MFSRRPMTRGQARECREFQMEANPRSKQEAWVCRVFHENQVTRATYKSVCQSGHMRPDPFQVGAPVVEAWFCCFPSSFLPADLLKVRKVNTSSYSSSALLPLFLEIGGRAHIPAHGLDTDPQTRQQLPPVSVVRMSKFMISFPKLQLGVLLMSSFLVKRRGPGCWEGNIFVTSACDTQVCFPKCQQRAAFLWSRPRPHLLMAVATDRKVEVVCGNCMCSRNSYIFLYLNFGIL